MINKEKMMGGLYDSFYDSSAQFWRVSGSILEGLFPTESALISNSQQVVKTPCKGNDLTLS